MKTIKNKVISLTIFSAIFVIAFLTVSFTSVRADSGDDGCDRNCQQDLARARAATARYHNVENAFADGFINTGQCVQSPAGAMGIHFINPSRIGNPSLDPAEPEVLLYLPDKHGRMQLIGLEYVLPASMSSTPPVLFGQTMQGPISHGGPLQYELHVWAWQHNPSGMFTPFNPKISCPQ